MDQNVASDRYDPFGPRAEFTLPTSEQEAAFSDEDRVRFQKLKAAYDACAAADQDLLVAEQQQHRAVAESRELEARIGKLPRLTQADLVRQMRECNV